MFGERLAELRKLNDDTQQFLADKIGFSVWAVRAWEQEKSLPPSDALLAICKLYGTAADYLLGLTDIDPLGRSPQTAPAPDRRKTERDAPLRRISVVETQKISRPARP